MNLPNKITMFRVIMIPAFLVFCYLSFPGSRYIALACFVVASLSDFLDGKIARSRNLVTDFGKFMDPLADKCLVTAAMLVFVEWGQMPAWVLAVVIAREFAVSGLRMMAASGGKVIAAAWSGKVKTAATMVCVILMFLPIPGWLNTVCWLVILVTTVYSGVEYFIKNRTVIDWSDL
ncbi:MAG: CDP-diacylglycerol--glycerol-3-phosphate 3-phosphatidyltransferase [Oscillospiraceae bacterium]|nr:CDP-diacylglycerol--glycerol-3-phosphate 3-phosphatidyltransferase [Oscillospiraceae bacterium]